MTHGFCSMHTSCCKINNIAISCHAFVSVRLTYKIKLPGAMQNVTSVTDLRIHESHVGIIGVAISPVSLNLRVEFTDMFLFGSDQMNFECVLVKMHTCFGGEKCSTLIKLTSFWFFDTWLHAYRFMLIKNSSNQFLKKKKNEKNQPNKHKQSKKAKTKNAVFWLR